MNKPFKPLLGLLLLFLLSISLTTVTALAAPPTGTEQIGFSVRALIPTNQRDSGKTYFDLSMEPNQTQEIQVEIENLLDQSVQVQIEVNSAYTNQIGGVEYQKGHPRDESLLLGIEDIITPSLQTVDIPPNNIHTATFLLTMPSNQYDGEIVGGIVITKINEKLPEADQGFTLDNVYSYVIGIVLSETQVEVLPDLTLVDVHPALVNARTAVVHDIRNSAPVLMKDATIDIEVYQEGDSQPLWTKTQSGIKMAPNSLMEYTFYLENQTLVAGNYHSLMQVRWQDKLWEFNKSFVVEAEQATSINNDSIYAYEQEPNLPSGVLIAVAIFLLLLFIILVIAAIVLYRKNKETSQTDKKLTDGD